MDPFVTTNPANEPEKRLPQRDRIPMSLPVTKLAVPEIPGYHCHWMRGDPARIQQALRAGYEWVSQDEVDLNTFGVGDGPEASGHNDLGSRVSILGGTGEDGGAQNLYLMKLRQEYWEADQKAFAERQETIASRLRGDKGLDSPDGVDGRYARPENRNIFQPKRGA